MFITKKNCVAEMKNIVFLLMLTAIVLGSCRPKPIAIDIAQGPPQIAIASTVLDAHTVYVAASYSITSLANLDDTSNGQSPIPLTSIQVDSALVTIISGEQTDTLTKVFPGLYQTTLNLVSGNTYTLTVHDYKSGQTVAANTTYQSALTLDSMKPIITRRTRDTGIQLKLDLRDDRPGTNYYVVAYDNVNPQTIPSAIGSANFSILNADEMKRVEVFSDAEAVNGYISETFNIDLHATDTLYVQYGRIDKGYYDFLSSYKRSGSILTQATAEPVTLPTNIINGLGYFSLYDAGRAAFVLRDY
jgi:hypothetical protein